MEKPMTGINRNRPIDETVVISEMIITAVFVFKNKETLNRSYYDQSINPERLYPGSE